MAMRKSSRISAKRSLDSFDDISVTETSSNNATSNHGIVEANVSTTNNTTSTSTTTSTNTTTTTDSLSNDDDSLKINNSNDQDDKKNKFENNNGDNSINKCTTDNGAMEIDLPLLEEVTEKAFIVTKEPPVSIKEQTMPVPPFELIESNIYHCDRKRACKDVRRLTCICELSKSELAKGQMGCGEDCLNRMMMIECGSRCKLGDNCSNKKFQRRQYCQIEPFPAGKKGWGIRAMQDIPG